MSLSERLARRRRELEGAPEEADQAAAIAEAEAVEAESADGEAPARPAPPTIPLTERRQAVRAPDARMIKMKGEIHQTLVDRFAGQLDLTDRHEVRQTLAGLVDDYLRLEERAMSQRDRELVIDSLLDDVLGLGPLEQLLKDPAINEIMINDHSHVYVELISGEIVLSQVTFESERQLRQVIDRIVSRMGRRVDESQPMVDARLPDGSRVNVVVPPLVHRGATMTIRKFVHQRMSIADVIRNKSATPAMMEYLGAAVKTRLTVMVSGGTSSGKTTLLNVLSNFIPVDERVITIEEAAELQLQQENVIGMEARPPNIEGEGEISIRELVKNALRMRPDRVIVGETRGPEALDMLQAMNTGHEGSMSTVHANNPEDVLSRLETLVLMGTDLPPKAIQKQIASAIDVIVQVERVRGGARRIVSITEIVGIEGDDIRLQEVFEYRQTGVSEEGRSLGYHTATGTPSKFIDHFISRGVRLDESIFVPTSEPPLEELY